MTVAGILIVAFVVWRKRGKYVFQLIVILDTAYVTRVTDNELAFLTLQSPIFFTTIDISCK
jgi:hypothetical protein